MSNGRIFVISDLHGHKEQFFDVLSQGGFSEDDHLYILGDVIDRGPYGIELLQYIKKQKNMTLLLGNHEEMMVYSVDCPDEYFEPWLQNGGIPTYSEYVSLPDEQQKEVMDYLRDLPLYKVVEVNQRKYLLVHAGIPLDHKFTDIDNCISVAERDDLLWIRETFLSKDTSHLEFTVVHGHTPTIYYLDEGGISVKPGKIGLDCGVFMGNRLGMLCLNDGAQYYSTL